MSGGPGCHGAAGLAARAAQLLGASWMGGGAPWLADDFPLQTITVALLSGKAQAETWPAAGPWTGGGAAGLRYRHDGRCLFGVITVDEAPFAAAAGSTALQRAAREAYERLFRLLADEGYAHLWRVWNYLAAINGKSPGLERYREFNVGRHAAFAAAGRLHDASIPAASALGLPGGPLSIAFLAARTPSVAVENPRQMSAYRYPAEYGPCSPTFSRAALARLPDCETLFVSGTASIVGHHSLHQGDAAAQTREIVANLDALLAEANRVNSGPAYRRDELVCRVYLRHLQDLAAVADEMRRALGAEAPLMIVQADVCRADLLVEVEAWACHRLR